MTTTKMRRGRRSLAAILAAMLMASVLAVVAGSPAQAANTSHEVFGVDTNNDGVDDAREFAGQDRYDTALRLAKNFATEKGGLGAVPAAFIASGDTLVDSISAAGFAGYTDAPILLTPSGSLHPSVADFIEDYGVGAVYVLGGSAAVSDAAVTAIEALTSKPTVTRIAGDDRYATAAAIAGMIEADASWCNTEANSAVLINGSSEALPFGVAVQTVAYRLQLPVLMTAADELPDATAEFIEANDIEHVQIIGGTSTVSAGVASAVTSLGVDAVQRVEGDSAAAVSVELAKLANNGCNDDLAPVSTDRVVLVRGNPDGVTAAPVLSSSLTGGALVTPLIVGDTLPASVRDYLAATPAELNGLKQNLGIVAVGGTAAVSQDVMDAALSAAASSGALTVRIGAGDDPGTADVREGDNNKDGVTNADDPVRPQTGTATFALYFTDDVVSGADATTGDGATLTAKLRDIIEVNGIPAVVNSAVTGAAGAGGRCANSVVYVTLGQSLAAGDKISVATSALKLGTAEDQRNVVLANPAEVKAAPGDSGKPQVSIIGIANPASGTSPGANAFTLTITDPGGLAAKTLTSADFTYARGSGSTNTSSTSTVDPVLTFGTAAIPGHTTDAPSTSFTTTVSLTNPLVSGDRLTLKSSRVKDLSGNMNSAKSGTAIKAQASPKITSVLMSNLRHSKHNSWELPDTAADATTGADGVNAVTITAKATGDAAGAAGNAWNIVFDTASTHLAAKPLDIDVRVDSKSKRATVRFINGSATVHDLVAAMRANEAFDSMFDVTLPCTGTTRATLAVSRANRNVPATSMSTGRTQFAIEVNFNRYISAVSATAHGELLEDLLDAAATRAKVANTETGIRADAEGEEGTAAGGGLSMEAADQTVVTGPTKKVRYEGETALAHLLPMARDLVETDAGHSGQTADATATPPIPAIAAAEAVAVGYAADVDPTTGGDPVEEDKNAYSQNRIAVSSNVKARN
ncbi:MAG: cell wall-binding repeat-containing protein [Acidimicrobiaceae bacterium]|nr:cell wall-binding repeat-containing protein [Acidimicrobiaceae bacterium]